MAGPEVIRPGGSGGENERTLLEVVPLTDATHHWEMRRGEPELVDVRCAPIEYERSTWCQSGAGAGEGKYAHIRTSERVEEDTTPH